MREVIDANHLRLLFDYEPTTGIVRHKRREPDQFRPHQMGTDKLSSIWNEKHSGKIAGSVNADGYRRILIYKRTYLAHRVVWAFFYGTWPTKHLDHINGNRDDNRIENLREASARENMHNRKLQADNTTGFKGVIRDGYRFRARIKVNGKQTSLGSFKTAEEAHTAYCAAADKHYGEFARAS